MMGTKARVCTPVSAISLDELVPADHIYYYLDRVLDLAVVQDFVHDEGAPYAKAMRKRKVWAEPLVAEGKQWHGMRRFRLRRFLRVNAEALLIAAGQNLKRLLQKRGWGHRPFPGGAEAAAACFNVLSCWLVVGSDGGAARRAFDHPPRRATDQRHLAA